MTFWLLVQIAPPLSYGIPMGIEAIKISSREHIVHTAMAGFDFATLKVQNDLCQPVQGVPTWGRREEM